MPNAEQAQKLLLKTRPHTEASLDRMIQALVNARAGLAQLKVRQRAGENQIEIDLRRLNDDFYCKKLALDLPTPEAAGYRFLYYFMLECPTPADRNALMEQYACCRPVLVHEGFGCAQINPEYADSYCLYVGKMLGGLRSRFKEHLGWGSNVQTFAMQLRQWVPANANVRLFMHWIRFERIQRELLLAIEESFHDELRPLLGQRGGR